MSNTTIPLELSRIVIFPKRKITESWARHGAKWTDMQSWENIWQCENGQAAFEAHSVRASESNRATMEACTREGVLCARKGRENEGWASNGKAEGSLKYEEDARGRISERWPATSSERHASNAVSEGRTTAPLSGDTGPLSRALSESAAFKQTLATVVAGCQSDPDTKQLYYSLEVNLLQGEHKIAGQSSAMAVSEHTTYNIPHPPSNTEPIHRLNKHLARPATADCNGIHGLNTV
ncbi:hypothetical protein K488DRAFT_67316 [Vararia minispora EC-137]|uniref:Uncharacterized protein n=1 Tax=Vararia minispora EC-137 TaxID=1314806 RepID=A0ACB8QZ55_9AGAM|nr:hypothetical protein K488DRAFT_67316 [Vararia minispora EC-137]